MRTNRLLTAACVAGCTMGATASQASIFAGFEDQTTLNSTFFTGSSTGDATAVDQWGGTAGDGWVDGWKVGTSGSIVRNKRVRDFNSLFGGSGNHVQFESSADSGFRLWANSREWTNFGDVSLTDTATFEFLYRPDDIGSFASGGTSFVRISDGGSTFTNGSTWQVNTTGGTTKRWLVDTGSGSLDSGLTIIAGNTYQFTITSDPTAQTFDISIDNLQDALPAYTASDLGYLQNVSEHAGNLVFKHQVGPGDSGNTLNYTYSLDSISIVPEPGSMALVGLGGLAMLRRRRRG